MADSREQPRVLYPEITPFDDGYLKVDDCHEIYYEQCGNKEGKPVIFLHGGPGAGSWPKERRFFDPDVYRVVLMDQRGAGKSKPAYELKDNTTWHLVDDIEKLRDHLSIDRWVVFGGSWGAALSLAYAETHPERVKALVLRGIFTLRRRELLWFYQDGASRIYPDAWEDFIKPIPEAERHDMISAYHRRLTGADRKKQVVCARAWSTWELTTSCLLPDPALLKRTDSDTWALQLACIENHYFMNKGFFECDDQLLRDVDKIRHIPITIAQGRYDVPCPADTAWELHKRLPEAEFFLVPDAGHTAREPGLTSVLVNACDKYKEL